MPQPNHHVTNDKNFTKPVTPYAQTHEEYIGSPSLQGGKTAKAKQDAEKAKSGEAAKAAKKLVKEEVTKQEVVGTNGVAPKYKIIKTISPDTVAERKAVESRIINDKSKTAMRAQIIEARNAKKN